MTPPLQKTVWLVNQFVPPDRAPTARLLDELASGLMERGWNVRFIGCTQGYHTGPVAGWRRWWRDLKAHARLFIRSLTGCKPEVVVCLTDPPALVFTMACVALLRGARLVHWPMDVYPEIAAALGVISNRSLAYKIIKHAADWGVGRCASVVILDEDMRRLFGKTAKSACPVVAPWPPSELKVPDKLPAPAPMMIRWTYSGNLGRAHEYATLLQAQRKIEDQGAHFELVFQGGGASRQAAQELALELGLKNCHWADYSDDSELVSSLLLSHLSIATQRPEMKGLLWPSKLALLDMLPRPILWVGAMDGAIAERLRQRAGLNGVFAPGDAEGLATWLIRNEADIRSSAQIPHSAESLRGHMTTTRERAVSEWSAILNSSLPS